MICALPHMKTEGLWIALDINQIHTHKLKNGYFPRKLQDLKFVNVIIHSHLIDAVQNYCHQSMDRPKVSF